MTVSTNIAHSTTNPDLGMAVAAQGWALVAGVIAPAKAAVGCPQGRWR